MGYGVMKDDEERCWTSEDGGGRARMIGYGRVRAERSRGCEQVDILRRRENLSGSASTCEEMVWVREGGACQTADVIDGGMTWQIAEAERKRWETSPGQMCRAEDDATSGNSMRRRTWHRVQR